MQAVSNRIWPNQGKYKGIYDFFYSFPKYITIKLNCSNHRFSEYLILTIIVESPDTPIKQPMPVL